MIRGSTTPGLVCALATIAALLTACSDDTDARADASDESPSSSPSGDLVQATRLADLAADTALTPGRYAIGFSSDQADPPMVLIDVPPGYRAGGDPYEIGTEANFRHF